MITEAEARQFAKDWVLAWNSHDLDAIMTHYGLDVILTSPVAARLLSDPSGTVTGREALRIYFQRGLEAYPNLAFELVDVMKSPGLTCACAGALKARRPSIAKAATGAVFNPNLALRLNITRPPMNRSGGLLSAPLIPQHRDIKLERLAGSTD